MLAEKVVNGLFHFGLDHREVLAFIHDPRYKLLREDLADMRRAAILTQTELAIRLGAGQPYISKAERGETYIDALLLVGWCAACGTQLTMVIEHIADYRQPELLIKS